MFYKDWVKSCENFGRIMEDMLKTQGKLIDDYINNIEYVILSCKSCS